MINIITETAWHHDGDYSFMKKLITDIIKNTNPDYIKLHISLDLNEYMYSDHPAYDFLAKRLLSEDQWSEIIKIIRDNGKKLILLLNDTKAINFGLQFSPEIVEIHSVCLNDYKLMHHLSDNLTNDKKIIIGVGGSTIYEIENAIHLTNSRNIILMHGFQNYPTKYEDINYRKIAKLINLFPEFEHGYADHTAWDNTNNILITLLATTLGINYIEKHVTNSYGVERTDYQAAITFDMFNEIQSKLELIDKAMGSGDLSLNKGELSYSIYGPNKKAPILIVNKSKNSKLADSDFVFKRTGQDTSLSQIDVPRLIGKELNDDLSIGHCLDISDFK